MTPWDIVDGSFLAMLQMRQDMRNLELAMEKGGRIWKPYGQVCPCDGVTNEPMALPVKIRQRIFSSLGLARRFIVP